MKMALDFSNAGYVYILTNESLGNLVKIGFTRNPPEHRAAELYTSGVPTPYNVWSAEFVENANKVEEEVHVRLFKNRSNRDREFFCISPYEAKKVIDQVILEVREDFLKNGQKQKQAQYSNPKFVEIIKLLKENQGKLFSDSDLAKELKISEKGVGQLIYMLESQETPVLYNHPDPRQDKKYGIYVKFQENQLDVLIKKYPNLDFSELKPLFEKKQSYKNNQKPYSQKTSSKNQFENKTQKQTEEQKPVRSENSTTKRTNSGGKFNPLNYNNPKFIELIKVLKENQGKLMTSKEISGKINDNLQTKPEISPDGVRKIINILENHQFDVVFIVPKTEKQDERFGIDFNFDRKQLFQLDKAFPKMNLSQLDPLFNKPKKENQSRKDIDALKSTEIEQEKEDMKSLEQHVNKIRTEKTPEERPVESKPSKSPIEQKKKPLTPEERKKIYNGFQDTGGYTKSGAKKFRF